MRRNSPFGLVYSVHPHRRVQRAAAQPSQTVTAHHENGRSDGLLRKLHDGKATEVRMGRAVLAQQFGRDRFGGTHHGAERRGASFAAA